MKFPIPKTSNSQKIIKNPNSIVILHGKLIKTQNHKDPNLITPVLQSYCYTSLDKAKLVFDQIERPTLYNWNYMIKGYALSDNPTKAIIFYDKMRDLGLNGNNMSFESVLKACGKVRDVVVGRKVHGHVMKLGYVLDLVVCNVLIHMYGCLGHVGFARKVFDEMVVKDLVSWNSLVCGYSHGRKYEEVLSLFETMRVENVRADAVTLVKVVLACKVLGKWDVADFVVEYVEENGVWVDVYLGNSLVDMYGKRGLVKLAKGVFDRMSEKNMVSWNAMLVSYVKGGDLVSARRFFDEMPKKDVVSWTSMITGYSQAGNFCDAVKLFRDMMVNKVKPDEVTVASALSACAHLGMLDMGRAIHEFIDKHEVRVDIYVGNSLIDMYCKCGDVMKASQVFQDMKEKDSVSWTAIISGLAVNGCSDSAVQVFEEMLQKNVRPTNGAFVGILQACVHSGLVDKGMQYFDSMQKLYGITPQMKHYGCIVDLLSRSGELDRAYEFIEKMPIQPDVVLWRILLSACKLHGNVALAEVVSRKLLDVDSSNSGNYVLLSDTYAGIGRWDAATKFRDLMEENYVQKPSAWSSVEASERNQF